MSEEYQTRLRELLTPRQQDLWERLSSCVEERYDMDILWNKGFGSWVVEKSTAAAAKRCAPSTPAGVNVCCS